MINMLPFFSLNIQIKIFQPGYPYNGTLNLMEQNIMFVPTTHCEWDGLWYYMINVNNIMCLNARHN